MPLAVPEYVALHWDFIEAFEQERAQPHLVALGVAPQLGPELEALRRRTAGAERQAADAERRASQAVALAATPAYQSNRRQGDTPTFRFGCASSPRLWPSWVLLRFRSLGAVFELTFACPCSRRRPTGTRLADAPSRGTSPRKGSGTMMPVTDGDASDASLRPR